jgi:cysteine desulfurase family protein
MHKPQEVTDAVVFALNHFGNASRGVYDESLQADRLIYDARSEIAELFNAGNPRQVAFSKNSTESLNIAIFGTLSPEDHVITSVSEHNSVLRPLNYLEDRGMQLSFLPIDDKGRIQIDKIPSLIQKNTKAIVITHASNVSGNITDLYAVSEFCKKYDLMLIVDGSQTAGSIEIDMQSMGIDILCFTGHKSLMGPQGIGGLCVNESTYIRPFIVGGTGIHSYDKFQPDKMPTRLESGTINSIGIAGLFAAVKYLKEKNIITLHKKALEVSQYFYSKLSEFEGIKFYGDYSAKNRAAIVSFNIGNMDSALIGKSLISDHNISTRVGTHCAPLLHIAFGTDKQGMVRFSFSHNNTFEEVDIAVEALKNIINTKEDL